MKKIFILILTLILLLSGCTKTETLEVKLYFPDSDFMYLKPELRSLEKTENIEKAIVEEVIKGPENPGLEKSVDGEVKVLSAVCENGICTVDLSGEFSEFNTGGSTKESMAVMSIVYSLCALEKIEAVKINIDGNENPEFGGHFTLDEPFYPDSFPDMVK